MNLRDVSGLLRKLTFRIARTLQCARPGGRISSFGTGDGRISAILIVNLKREPKRWSSVSREIARFRTFDGASLLSIARRFDAVDARDGRAVAATADVDPNYRMEHQLYVQPDARLLECFGADAPVKMTRQEVAVARSHIEIWKMVASGPHKYVLVLEDDVWFRAGAARMIEDGWRIAMQRCAQGNGPQLLYLSYADAGGTAERVDECDSLFRPLRGLWFLSGYVLSREGAAALLRAMPVVGPVDLWMNYRFNELGALALAAPAILQRQDVPSDNSYSVVPFLARAGIVDAKSHPMAPEKTDTGPVLAFSDGGERESLAMALSMLGLRVRVFDGTEAEVGAEDLFTLFDTFDALVDAPLAPAALSVTVGKSDAKFILEAGAERRNARAIEALPASRTAVLPDVRSWSPICNLLGLSEPTESYPVGTARDWRLFRDDRPEVRQCDFAGDRAAQALDHSPWVLPADSDWHPRRPSTPLPTRPGKLLIREGMTGTNPAFAGLVETFPGNSASFAREGLGYDTSGAALTISQSVTGQRPLRSGAFASRDNFEHGRFEAEIKAARGSGLVTGFFLHRDAPRQEIDIEILGSSPGQMLVNVYFNPGDDGAAIGFGYRGSPCRIDLGFDATLDFHRYAIEWTPRRIAWLVDGRVVHERVGWDPTPIPHLPMRLHGNLWAPRSEELAGKLDRRVLPATANFRNVSVWGSHRRCFSSRNNCIQTALKKPNSIVESDGDHDGIVQRSRDC